MKKRFNRILLGTFAILMGTAFPCVRASSTNDQKFFFSDVVNAGHDTGFAKSNTISSSDPHYGWKLGQFCVEGYTDQVKNNNGYPVFLKNVGNTVRLSFQLSEDIDRLHASENLSINEDTNGYDAYFRTERTNCGRGMLIIRKTDDQNQVSEPIVYTDYLSALTKDANTEIDFFEEGDYEVALDYEVKESRKVIGPIPWIPKYNDYRIFFRFSVRNGNCMAYPVELNTFKELANGSITSEGFTLDLANSKYLSVQVKYEVPAASEEGPRFDTRYNRPARHGEKYEADGVYTITVHNQYTHAETVKTIYVGSSWEGTSVQEQIVESTTPHILSHTVELEQLPSTQSSRTYIVRPIIQYAILACLILIVLCLLLILLAISRKVNKVI